MICGPIVHHPDHPDHPEAATNPLLIVEVISESSESYDRGEKFKTYRLIPSFCEYVLIEQRTPLVEVFYKIDSKSWRYRVYDQLHQIVQFSSIEVEIPMEEIYSGIHFQS